MKKLKLTQTRSLIGQSQRQKDTMAALGLNKIRKSVEHTATPQILGMVKKIEHLVKIEEA